ncbi:putative AC transposase [Pseudolycoriella hygida]|uniref:AC transposase n=1 Tax=Pseudolycoriella hygida TaxID=35572 RepID=A0A9Q0MMK4_9DIPT|nr:putative AC transposase [Pseudolycoriella hygida]
MATASSNENDNLVVENVTVEVMYIEMGEESQTSSSQSVKKRPAKTRSNIYQFFNFEEGTGPVRSAQNNMLLLLLEVQTKESGRKSVPGTQNTVPEEITKEMFRRKLIEFIVCIDQAFTLFEEPTFKDSLKYSSGGNAECELFSATTAKKLIVDLYEEKKANLESVLRNNEGKISYVVDCWTSSNQFPFQGVVGKWISNDWKMCLTVIDLTVLQGSHTGKLIANSFWGVLKEYNLCEKLLSVTADNTSNVNTMFEELEIIAQGDDIIFDAKNYRVRCFAHIMNLTCQDIINSIGDGGERAYTSDIDTDDEEDKTVAYKELQVVTKLRKGIVGIRRSPQRRELLGRQCVAANIETKMVLRDVKTRWNSALIMCERASELREPFDLTLRAIPKLRKYILDDDEWCKINEPIKILSPFLYQVLLYHLEKYKKNDYDIVPGPANRYRSNSEVVVSHPEWLVRSAVRGLDKLENYYPSTDGLVYIVATDPRYKLTWYKATGWPKEWIDFCRKSVTDLYKSQYKPQTQEKTTQPITTTNPRQTFDDIFSTQMKNHVKSSTDDELKKYLNDGVVDPDLLRKEKTGIDGALGWWSYPSLAKMAKDFLAASGTGVPVERLFSDGPDLLSHRRQSMAPETIKICICLKSWLKSKELFQEDIRDAMSHKLAADAQEINLF